jgi:hypothetical protein
MADLPPARILDVDPDAYHRLPGFSATIAKEMTSRSTLHGWDMFERKLEDAAEELSDDQVALRERGSVLHALVLGKGKRIAVLPYADYRTKEAKSARDEARANNLLPVKEAKMEVYAKVAAAIKSKIAEAGHILDGTSEMAIEWHERTPRGPVQCRAMLDHVVAWGLDPRDEVGPLGAVIYDLKIVDDAEPGLNERTAERLGYAIQAAAYTRALTALHPRLGGRIEFRFLFCEPKRPYAIWDPKPSGPFRELGERRWRNAVCSWAEGLATKRWPSYRDDALRSEISAPMWVLRQEGFTSEE